MTGKNRDNYNKNYIAYVNSFDPPTDHTRNCFRAFMVGGLICCIGQFIRYILENAFALSGNDEHFAHFLGYAFDGAWRVRSDR